MPKASRTSFGLVAEIELSVDATEVGVDQIVDLPACCEFIFLLLGQVQRID